MRPDAVAAHAILPRRAGRAAGVTDDDEAIHPDFRRWIAGLVDAPDSGVGAGAVRPLKPLPPGTVVNPVAVDRESAAKLVVTAAKLAVGFFRPTNRTEVVWVEADSELAVGIAAVGITIGDGVVEIRIPVRCDQSGPAEVLVTFAVGGPGRPAGLYAATPRRPTGPPAVVDVWGEALVAFAWQTLLGLAAQIAGAVGKDARGNILVPVELSASRKGLTVLPMARHHFAGSSGLTVRR